MNEEEPIEQGPTVFYACVQHFEETRIGVT